MPAGSAAAQSGLGSASSENLIYLQDTNSVKSLTGKVLLFYPESQSGADVKDVIRLYRSKSPLLQKAGGDNVLKKGQSVYAVIPVINAGKSGTWTIKLVSPDLFPGFKFTDIRLWDGQTGRPLSKQGTVNGISFSLPPKATKPLILELEKSAGLLGSFGLTIEPADFVTSTKSMPIAPLIALSTVMAFLILSLYFSLQYFSTQNLLRIIAAGTLFSILYIFSAGLISPFIHLPFILFSVFLLSLCLVIKSEISQHNSGTFTPLLLLIASGAAILASICAIIASMNISFEFLPLFYGLSCFAAILLLTVAAFIDFFSNQRGLPLLIATLFLGITGLLLLLIYGGMLSANPLIFNGFSFACIALVLAASAEIITHFFSGRKFTQTITEISSANPALSKKVREVKESYDHTRLLQVLENERTAMKALQVREASQIEAMARAKRDADEANNAKSAFLAMVSHEIRTPMTGVLGMVRFLKNTSLSEEQAGHVNTIEESGNTIMGLLNDILDFEKIETGQMTLEIIDFDLHRLMQSIYSLAKGYASDKNLDVHLNIDESIPQILKGDPTRLRQVLLNLINNAIKFTQNGSVTVTLKSISSENNQAQVYFAVEDTGIGISKEAQTNLFNPFKQADKSTSRKYGGSGLGLAISQKLIGLMGGTINIKSALGEGSNFFFTLSLPVGDVAQAESISEKKVVAPAAPVEKTTEYTHRVFIVEDNAINQKVIGGLVEEIGFEPVFAGSGEEAVEVLQNNTNFDIILMDIEMPGISGVETTQRIRGELGLPEEAFPIIALTGNTQPKDVETYLASGMTGFLAKPIDAEALHSILESIKNGTYLGQEPAAKPQTQEVPKHTVNEPVEHKALPADNAEEQTAKVAKEELTEPPLNDLSAMNTGLSLDEGDEEEVDTSQEFDEAQLISLKSSLKESDLKEMLDELVKKMDSITSDIKAALGGGNFDLLKAKGHEIKGMCANFGLKAVADAAQAIEEAAKQQDKGAALTSYAALEGAIKRGKSRLENWIKD